MVSNNLVVDLVESPPGLTNRVQVSATSRAGKPRYCFAVNWNRRIVTVRENQWPRKERQNALNAQAEKFK